MGDERKTSASDELIGRARDHVSSDFGEFDAEPIHTPDYDSMLDLEVSTDLHGANEEMSAAEIAAQLAELHAEDEPETEPEPEPEPKAEAASIPDWARGESQELPIPERTPQPPVDAGGTWSDDTPIGDEGDRWSTSSPEWEAYQAQRDAKRAARSRFDLPMPSIRTLIGLGVLGFFLVPVIFNAVTGREHITTLHVGDCFTAGTALEVETVPVVDCAEEHDSELFAKVDATSFGSTYPGQNTLFEWAFEECIARFEGYVGEPYASSPYYVETFVPLSDGWSQGDRTALCTVVVVDSELNTIVTTGSRRGIAERANA